MNMEYYFIIFITAFIIYYLLPQKFQNLFLAAANLTFIAFWGMESLIVLIVSLMVSFGVYLKICERKKIYLVSYIVFQISLLVFYKTWSATFPIGISYYSLTIIAYLLEVYWRRTDLRVTPLEYFLSVSFFPVIMTGPIERLTRLTPQLRIKRTFDLQNFKSGFYFIGLGLFKVTAISNPLTALIRYSEAAAHEVYGFGLVSYCILAFFKLYAEFSGFIDIVTGVAWLLGLRVSKNFDRPYFAVNVNDVWKRWHISLTSWLRDFVFLPLVLKTKNIIFSSVIVFLLVGLWHGVRADFIYWSFYWIFFYLIYYAFQKHALEIKSPTPVKIAVTFLVTSLSTLCFMIPGSGLLPLLQRLFLLNAKSFSSLVGPLTELHINIFYVLISIILMIVFESLKEKQFTVVKTILLFFLIALLGEMTAQSMLYLRI